MMRLHACDPCHVTPHSRKGGEGGLLLQAKTIWDTTENDHTRLDPAPPVRTATLTAFTRYEGTGKISRKRERTREHLLRAPRERKKLASGGVG